MTATNPLLMKNLKMAGYEIFPYLLKDFIFEGKSIYESI
jgi:hypothetical protein